MTRLRRWRLQPADPFSLPLAADARLCPTDYTDDQVWRLALGTGDSPALALQTKYGGRVGLASIIPLWFHDGRTIYEAQGYAVPPIITGFAPGYLRVQASLNPQLALLAEYWSIDSHTIGARFTLSNAHTAPTQVRLDLFGHVGAQGKEQPLGILPLDDNLHALHMGRVGNLNPVIALEDGSADLVGGEAISPKIGRTIDIGGRKKASLRWVHAGLPTIRDSLTQAQHWLQRDWQPHQREVVRAAAAIPIIETGDNDLDATLATAYYELVVAFLKPTANLPHSSFVARRDTDTGFSRHTDGSDHPRAWSGQSPHLAYLAGLGIAPVDPQLAQGLVRNYLAVQQEDGWIDWQPGLGGQRRNLLCMPILARLTWGIFQYTEDDTFLHETFPALLKFFRRWLQEDRDGDGLPEWQNEAQTGYRYWPAFGSGLPWTDNTAIDTVETPDLLAYLLSEAISLRAIAYYLRDAQNEQNLNAEVEKLQAALETLWDGGQYRYRDRDTHRTTGKTIILEDSQGDVEHIPAMPLNPPARLNICVEGGVDHTPRLSMRLDGLSREGDSINIIADHTAFTWQRGRGVFTTDQVLSQIDRVVFDGLSRVYQVSIATPDLVPLDINPLLPLWSVGLSPERNEQIVERIIQPDHFWRESGVTMCSAQDGHFDSANKDGSGGVWPFWLTLIGEGLIEAGRIDLATDLLRRLLHVQVAVLKRDRHFSEFYDSDQAQGLGTPGHLGGSVPLHLLMRVSGVRIISSRKVWAGGAFHWPAPVTIRQHGVVVQRTAGGTTVRFSSGFEAQLPADADWQEVLDSSSDETR